MISKFYAILEGFLSPQGSQILKAVSNSTIDLRVYLSLLLFTFSIVPTGPVNTETDPWLKKQE